MGQSVPRKEDNRLVQGQGVFVDDVKRHGMGYLHFVRSPYAHAKIGSIDVSAALELPGVYGTLTGDEVAILTDPFFQIAAPPGGHVKDYALAVGKVRYLGEPVVAVVAETRELARDAAELVLGRLRAAARRRRRTPRRRPRRARAARGSRRQHVLHRHLGVGRRRCGVRRGRSRRHDQGAPLRPLQLDSARDRRRPRRVQPRHRPVDDHDEQPVPGVRRDHDGARHAHRRSTSSASSPRTSAAASATRSRRIRNSSPAACSRASSTARSSGPSGAPSSTSPCRTATSAGSSTPRSPSRPTARCSASARRRSTTPAPTSATSRSAASSGRRWRRACTAGATSGSSSPRC